MKKFFTVILTIALGLTVAAQSPQTNVKKDLNRYVGKFSMVGFSSSTFGTESKEGIADYLYRNASGGTRIFEGEFVFNDGKGNFVYGQFKNDKQVGVWEWINRNDEDFDVTFNDDGVPDGRFHIGLNIHGIFENGKLVSYWYNGKRLWLYGDLKNGKPTGTWKIRGKDVPNGEAIVVFDNSGEVINAYTQDVTTGDKYGVSENICNLPYEMGQRFVRRIKAQCFRSTWK